MLKIIDDFLNSITMYRLTLYYLIGLLLIAEIFSLLKILSFDPLALLFTTLFITSVCYLAEHLFAKIFEIPANVESFFITGLILALIVSPIDPLKSLPFLAWVAVLAIVSKYIIAWRNKHIFNPAAIAVVITAFALNRSANWWVGTLPMLPFVVVGGILVVRKIRRLALVSRFFVTAALTILIFSFLNGTNVLTTIKTHTFYTPMFFLGFVMLTEPMTTPPTKFLQTIYGVIVGFLLAPQIHIASIYTTPEIALIIGNIFSFLVSPKYKLLLKLKEKRQNTKDAFDFIFTSGIKINFKPGQYLEWTLDHGHSDSRGNRRFFTIASSPTEKEVTIGVKFHPNGSSFKKALLSSKVGSTIVAAQLTGDFVLPSDVAKKLVFVAGGIGVTPFRSMVKYLLDADERRDVTLIYSEKDAPQLCYQDIFDEANTKLGIKVIYNLTDSIGRLDVKKMEKYVPDYQDSHFYISGPHAFVTAIEDVLTTLRISKRHVVTDYFPGFA